MINVRSNGKRLYAARRVATGYWWESYGPLDPADRSDASWALFSEPQTSLAPAQLVRGTRLTGCSHMLTLLDKVWEMTMIDWPSTSVRVRITDGPNSPQALTSFGSMEW